MIEAMLGAIGRKSTSKFSLHPRNLRSEKRSEITCYSSTAVSTRANEHTALTD